MNKKYWLRGGIVGSVIGIIFSVYQASRNWCLGSYMKPDGTIGSSCPPVNILDNMMMLIFPELMTIVGLLILGSFAGWVYGKIKSKFGVV